MGPEPELRRPGRAGLTIATKVGLCVAVLGGALFLAGPVQAVNSQVFPDRAGESGAAPDLTQIQVSNDDKGGMTFVLAVSGQPSLRAGDSIFVDIDSDLNAATGAPNTNGADYLLNLFIETGSLYTYRVCRWNGSWDCSLQGQWTDRPATSSSHTVTLSLQLATKVSRTIRFWLQTWSNRVVFDFAPDGAPGGTVFSYEQRLTPDFDRDGLRGAADRCPRLPRGRFDRNGDGCPGPFPLLPKPDFRFRGVITSSHVMLSFFRIRNALPGTKVTVSFEGRRVTRRGNGLIPALAKRRLPFGLRIRIVFTQAGRTGRFLDATVGRNGPNPLRAGCVAGETLRPSRCP